jgi:hypothetical protein
VISDSETYWATVDKWWDQLLEIASHHLDLQSPAFEKPGDPESAMTGRTVLEELIFLKRARNKKLPRYFNAIWGMASESYAWSVPGWGQLCDLCSEEGVLPRRRTRIRR